MQAAPSPPTEQQKNTGTQVAAIPMACWALRDSAGLGGANGTATAVRGYGCNSSGMRSSTVMMVVFALYLSYQLH